MGNKTKKEELTLHTAGGSIERIHLMMSGAEVCDRLCIGLFSMEGGYPSFCGNVTADIPGELPAYCAYVDTECMPELAEFLARNRIAETTEMKKKWGNAVYPLYRFSPERLRELCPEGLARYEAAKGLFPEQNEIQKSRR